jgi:hypothetical protein
MATFKEFATAYSPPQTKNIADLPKVSIDLNIQFASAKDSEGEEFVYNFIELNTEKYRVPNSVVGQIKDILQAKPDLKEVKVIKSGTGMQTRYTVIPL